MDDISNMTNNINWKTVGNGSDDTNPSVQIAGSHALCVFINTVSMIWISLFIWMTIIILWLLDYCIWRKVGPERAKAKSYRRFLLTEKWVIQVWSGINFTILWSNLSFIIYCYTPHHNCVLYYEDDTSMTNAGAMLIVATACTYVAQFVEAMLHFHQHRKTTESMLNSLQEKMSHLISAEKPVVKWTATCSHTSGNDRVVTHKEERLLEYGSWETSGVWLETLCGYKELSQDGAVDVHLQIQDATRYKITVQVCAGDQETTQKWLAQRDTFEEFHRKNLHDIHSLFTEERLTSNHYFRDVTVSAKKTYISIGYIVSAILGLGPPIRLRLHMQMPEKHYLIEKCVFSGSNTRIQERTNGFSNRVFAQEEPIDSGLKNEIVC